MVRLNTHHFLPSIINPIKGGSFTAPLNLLILLIQLIPVNYPEAAVELGNMPDYCHLFRSEYLILISILTDDPTENSGKLKRIWGLFILFEPLNIAMRVLLALTFLFAATRFLTKRILSNLTYFDYVAAAILGTIAGNLAFNVNIHILNFILSLTLTTLIIVSVSYISLKYRPLRKFLAGEPIVLIENGKILEHNMANLNYSYDNLNQQLRQEGVFNISLVEYAILEPSGKLSVQVKSSNRPLTPQDLNVSTQYEGLATELILDGKVLEQNLRYKGLSHEWLYKELTQKGVKDVREVAFAALSTNGNLYIDLYHDYK